MVRETRLAWRSLTRRKGLMATALASLTLGVGANTAIFSVVDAVVLRPLPLTDARRVFAVREMRGGQATGGNPRRLYDWMEQLRGLEAGAGFYTEQLAVGGSEEPRRVPVVHTFGDLFGATGVGPAVGRGFSAEEMRGRGEAVAVVSSRLARGLFGEPASAVGRSLEVNGAKATIVGVMGQGMGLPNEAEAWLPAPEGMQAGSRKAAFLFTFARLREGVSEAAATAEWRVLEQRLAAQYPDSDRGLVARLEPLENFAGAETRQMLRMLFAVSGLVLLIACWNIATLLLSRAAERQREASIRKALGGGDWSLARAYLSESLLLSAMGGVLSAGSAAFLVDVLKAALPPDLPRLETAAVDWRVLLFCTVVSLVCGLVFGAGPAWYAARAPMQPAMNRAARRPWLSGALVVSEVAVCLLLLTAAGSAIGAFLKMRGAPLGFDTEQLMTVRIAQSWNTPKAKLDRFHREALEQLGAIAGVRAVGLMDRLPLGGGTQSQTVRVSGAIPRPELESQRVSLRGVSSGYLETLGVRFLRGGGLQRTGEAVVNEEFWKTYLGGGDAVGREIATEGGRRFRITGVAANIQQNPLVDTPAEVFVPMEDVYWPIANFVLRAQVDAWALRRAVRERIRELDAGVWIDEMGTLEQKVVEAWSAPRLVSALMGGFALLALLLASVGIHGIVAGEVAQRRREIGIRAAMGAAPGRIAREVLRRGMRLAWVGGGMGLGLSFWGLPVLRGLPGGAGVEAPIGPLLAAGTLLLCAAGAASYWPARRAARIDPAETLRSE
ncbi:MAG: ABC transporter permease [Bryobacterales bacterium]|nr:ABC transporter permease [Bryobacterales bacterium]